MPPAARSIPRPQATPTVAPTPMPPLQAVAITAAAAAQRPTDRSPSRVILDRVSSRVPARMSRLTVCRGVRPSSSRFSVQGVKAMR